MAILTSSSSSALAAQADVEGSLGRALTTDEANRLDALLARASAKVRAYTHQDFTHATTTDVLRIVNGEIDLPQRPVIAVTSVKLVGFDGVLRYLVPYQWDAASRITLYSDMQVINLPELILDANSSTAEVTYEHGYATVPDAVTAVVADMVARCYLTPVAPGVQSANAGPIGYRLAAGYGAQPVLTDDDKNDLRPWAPPAIQLGMLGS